MKHAELVRLGTDLLAETQGPERWLPQYDQALVASGDEMLVEFVNELGRELHVSIQAAA